MTRLVTVRDEQRAYPAITGPRTLFEVDTPALRLALTYQHRSRRWTIQGLDEDRAGRLRPDPDRTGVAAPPRRLPWGLAAGRARARSPSGPSPLAAGIESRADGQQGTGRIRSVGALDPVPTIACVEPTVRFRDLTVDEFVARLASGEPVPGGGSAAAIAGSLGAGLVAMVAALSDRPRYAAHRQLHAEAGAAAARSRTGSSPSPTRTRRPTPGSGPPCACRGRPSDERAARAAAIRAAALVASEVPFRTVEACRELVGLAESLAGRCNTNAASTSRSRACSPSPRRTPPPRTSRSTSRRSATRRARPSSSGDGRRWSTRSTGSATTARAHVHGGETRDPLAGPA